MSTTLRIVFTLCLLGGIALIAPTTAFARALCDGKQLAGDVIDKPTTCQLDAPLVSPL